MFVISIIFLLTASNRIIEYEVEYVAAQEEYRELRLLALVETQIYQPYEAPETEGVNINFDALRAINSGTVGWIRLHDSDISYPIVQGTDNRHYLYYTFTHHQNSAGAIFLDYRDDGGFNGLARVYGHNMQNGSMFGTLRTWQGENIIIHIPAGHKNYTVHWRGIMTESDIVRANFSTDLVLITCVTGNRYVRYVIRAQRSAGNN